MIVFEKIKNKVSGKDEIKATLCYLISNICTKAFGFITIPLYTNILTISEYGYLNTYNAWVSLLSVVMGLSLSSAIFGKTKLEREERNKFQSSIISLSLLSALIITITVLCVYVVLYGQLDIIILLALLQGYGTFVINFILQEWIIDNKYISHSFVSVGSIVIPIVITCIIINKAFQTKKYLSVIIPKASVVILLMVLFVIMIIARGKVVYDKSIWAWGLRYCVPVVFHSLSLTVMLQADRVMISSLYGLEESGIYSFIYNVTLVVGVLIAALENTWKTWFFKKYESTTITIIQNRCKLFTTVAILGISVYVFISPDLVRILAAEAYHTQMFLVGPIAFAYVISFLYDFLVYVEYKKEVTINIAKASIAAAIVNVVLNYFIIPIYGGRGAACTTCIAYALQFCMHLVVVRKIDKDLFPVKLFIPFIILNGSVMVVFLLCLNAPFIRHLLALFFAVLMLGTIYKKRTILV